MGFMRLVIQSLILLILCRCATKHQAIAFEPYFPNAPDELLTSSVIGEIQGLELKEGLTLLEKKRLIDLYLIEVKRLAPNNDRLKAISNRSEMFRSEVEPLLRRMGELKAELLAENPDDKEAKGFEDPRLKKVYTAAYRAWNLDENEKALGLVEQITSSEEYRKMASKADWVKVLNLRFRIAMDLNLIPKVLEAYSVLKDFSGCAPETAQAGFIVSLLAFSEGRNEDATKLFKEQCDSDDSLPNRLKRAYWKFRFQKGDSKEGEVARQELLSMPMPGYYAYLSYLVKNERMPVSIKSGEKSKYLDGDLKVSNEVHELFLKAEGALQSNLKKDAGLYTGKAIQHLKGKPAANVLPLLYAAHLLRAAGHHLDSMKIFSFLLSNDRELSSEDLVTVQKEIPDVFPRPFGGLVDSVGKNWSVDPDFVYSIMRQESAFNPAAVSSADARGLMQMMPALGKSLSGQWRSQRLFHDRLLFSAPENLKLAVFHLHQLETWGPHLALMAASYNAGINRVVKWWQRFGHLPLDVFVEFIPIGETRNYVKLVLRNYLYYKALKSDGALEPNLFSLNLPAFNKVVSPRL